MKEWKQKGRKRDKMKGRKEGRENRKENASLSLSNLLWHDVF
jgi:hypothetical protein